MFIFGTITNKKTIYEKSITIDDFGIGLRSKRTGIGFRNF